jgi:type II secretory ATPase GspE/PulE/Tfp pilus assembly ATPase PilB-like protein/ActR/RegA family two-component response regulator
MGSWTQGDIALHKFLIRLGLLDSTYRLTGAPREEHKLLSFLDGQELINEEKCIEALADALCMDWYRLKGGQLTRSIALLKDSLFKAVSINDWRSFGACPVVHDGDVLVIAMANPLDCDARIALEFRLEHKVVLGIALEQEITRVLDRAEQGDNSIEVGDILEEILPESSKEEPSYEAVDTGTHVNLDDPQAAPVIRIVNKIFRDAVIAEASDVHLTPEVEGLVVKMRVDGILRQLFVLPRSQCDAVISRIKLLAKMDISEKRLPQDGKIRMITPLGKRDLRVSTVPSLYGENIVARILAGDLKRHTLQSLGMSDELREKIIGSLRGSSRMFLATGPTGSGKTSTLYALLGHFCDGTRNIITLEDPIEYRLPGVTQIQTNAKVGMTFAQGLRAVLRQDPDVVLVGEIRDGETAQIAMQAAQTGHLVLSSVHTNSAVDTVIRLIDLGVPPYVVASALGGVLAQRLVRRLCDCKVPARESEKENARRTGIDTTMMCGAAGCSECGGTGYKGRAGVYSLLTVDAKMAEAIHNNGDIHKAAAEQGVVTLWKYGSDLVAQGITSFTELERVVEMDLGPSNNVDQKSGLVLSDPPEKASSPMHLAPTTIVSPNGSRNGPLSKKRLLIVDDDDNTLFLFKELFEDEMYEVDTATSGSEAIERIFAQPPDLVVSDLMMPGMSGLQLTQKLAHNSATQKIPVVILTANISEETELSSLQTGARDVVSKCSDLRVILARIQNVIRQQENLH